ncbi:hypothetical protein POJ06DRAFT_238792 [Lipomyces tetrasporus]|uniref:Uncharacterized protein n=1 Tax=Lipomyces tetrasporus TaxID=54092 RepID=A0AAD7QUN7_9ASCO|nr:uncharacterized protein POJ06DRAFT_238792 [Lipomyces tetrasporus]KAJ8100052.1 hypothetical protein POJ06DRAFT_238792 [Lipomyces tetrasporus]
MAIPTDNVNVPFIDIDNIKIPACTGETPPIVHETEHMFAWIYGHEIPDDYTGSNRKFMSVELTEEMNELLNNGATEEQMQERYSEYFSMKDDAYYKWLNGDNDGAGGNHS